MVKVYNFGVVNKSYMRPSPQDKIEEQIGLGHKYQNQLIAMTNKSWERYREIRSKHFPDFERAEVKYNELVAEIDKVREGIKANNAKEKRRTATPEQKAIIKGLQEAKKEVSKQLKEMRGKIKENTGHHKKTKDMDAEQFRQFAQSLPNPDFAIEVRLSQQETSRTRCELREKIVKEGLFWGNYQLREENVDRAASSSTRKGAALEFRRWHQISRQSIAHHFQGEMTWDKAISGSDRRLRVFRYIDPRPQVGSQSNGRFTGQKKIGHEKNVWIAEFWMRSADKKPVYCVVPFLMPTKRPIPGDAKISWIKLKREKLGQHPKGNMDDYRFFLQFTVGEEEEQVENPLLMGVAVGWRKYDDRLHVATIVDENGQPIDLPPLIPNGCITIPQSRIDQYQHPQHLRSIRDKNFDEIKAKLLGWMKDREISEEMKAQFKDLHAWKSCARLFAVVQWWKKNRFAGDEEIFVALRTWAYQEDHLYRWESNERLAFQDWRLDYYRNCAFRLKDRKAVIANIDWSKLQLNPPAESNENDDAAKMYKNVASVYLLEMAIKNKMPHISVDAQDITHTCASCGEINDFDSATTIIHTCEACRQTWAVEDNTAKNVLARGEMVDETPAIAR